MARTRRRFRQHRRPNLVAGLLAQYGTRRGAGRALARRLDITPMYLSLLARGKRPITANVADRIERAV